MNATTDLHTDRKVLFVQSGESPDAAIAELRESLQPGDWLAFDVETTALWPSDKTYDYIRSVQVGSKTVAVLLDPFDERHRAAAREILTDASYRLTAHNGAFDILRLVRARIFPSVKAAYERLFDTLIAAKLLYSGDNLVPLSLKELTVALCGEQAASKSAKAALIAEEKRHGWKGVNGKLWNPYAVVSVSAVGNVTGDPRDRNTWALIDRDNEAFIDYCAADVFDSAVLAEKMEPVVTALWKQRLADEHRLSRLVCEMQQRGVAFDHDRAVETLKDAHARRDAATAAMLELGVDVSEAKDADGTPRADLVGKGIIAEGIDVPRTQTANGTWQFELDKRSLKKYESEGSKIAPLFRAWKQADKEIGTYLAPLLKTRPARIHADIQVSEARTGRMSARKPNVQNVPPIVKPCYIADTDMVLVSADFSSVEMRVAAAITNDPKLKSMYLKELPEGASERDKRACDPYWLVAWKAFGDNATESDRKLSKILCLGQMYGGGAPALAKNADVPVSIVRKIHADYRDIFKTLTEWWKAEKMPAVRAGAPFWTLPSGRFQALDPSIAWAGFNTMIQGLARDVLLGAMCRLEDAGLSEYMLLPIHDEIIFQVPRAEAEALRERIAEVMATVLDDVPITTEAVILGARWIDKDDAKRQEKKWAADGNPGHWWDSDC